MLIVLKFKSNRIIQVNIRTLQFSSPIHYFKNEFSIHTKLIFTSRFFDFSHSNKNAWRNYLFATQSALIIVKTYTYQHRLFLGIIEINEIS